jgi:hypothetical protein
MGMSTATLKTAPGLSVVTSMHAVIKHSLSQLSHFKDGRQIAATPREVEMIQRQAASMRAVAAAWTALADSIEPSS